MIKTTTTNSLNNKIQDYFEQYLKKEINDQKQEFQQFQLINQLH